MELWWLLLRQYSYLPIPQRWQAQPRELPRALYLLPFYGLLVGLACWGAARFAWIMGSRWSAVLLLGLTLLLNGGVWLRDILLLAEGRPPLAQTEENAVEAFANASHGKNYVLPRPVFGRTALIVGCFYLLLQYLCFLLLLRRGLAVEVLVAAAVFSRWVYLWGVYDFAALAPAFLHRGVTLNNFARASAVSLLLLTACAFITPALLLSLLLPLLGALLLYRSRVTALGALDEATYGAAAAWSEIMLYLSYLIFGVWL